ncbi:MAG: glycogen synthase GlgA [Nitrospira sp.]
MNIVIAASEAVPYVKTGGLADVAGALPVELARLGHHVTLVLPRYRDFKPQVVPASVVGTIQVPTPKGLIEATLEEERVAAGVGAQSVRVIAVRYDPFFDRPGLYQSESGDFSDNLNRFAFFSRAVLEVVARLKRQESQRTDILHLHDWQLALAAVYLKTLERNRAEFEGVKTLLTLHNVGYQGLFPGEQFRDTGLPATLFTLSGLEFYGSVNLLKGGILYADAISTVSPTYAEEIVTPDGGFGLEGVLAGRADQIVGITNGIDVRMWDPEADSYLPAHFSKSDLSGKLACKQALQAELGLPCDDVPLLGVIGRLTSQKGFDLLVELLPELMLLGVQLAILGTGDKSLETGFRSAKERYPKHIGLSIGFDEGLAHRIEAGADILIMPSRYEPCGLTQLYSLRYGTIPIVRRTGGLADTVIPYRPSTVQSGTATGFHFGEMSSAALLSTVLLALNVFHDQSAWKAMQTAGMSRDSSWSHAAKIYAELFARMKSGGIFERRPE